MDFWLARSAIACVASLQLLVVNDFSLGPRWLAPTLELALLVPLSAATAWNQGRARHATTDAHWADVHRHHRLIRRMALFMTALVTVANTAALSALVRALLNGKAAGGSTLLIDALNIWGTNVVIFALWFWTTDRGGAALRGRPNARDPDFLFPQMTFGTAEARAHFAPGFVDYLFLAFTNATAFSPTDTLPLTARAKLLMMAEALVSLLTVALVAARAVNILA
ncbi:hypothetical protein MKK75_12480 [Methylobacterium sp. J-030]|nr:hypothetical protein [Methylobacterium sp. J-030]MCJ2069595.1 hypothetical protein [Methylobacterium sp. J-030]